MSEEPKNLGPTGWFPRGKADDADEGEIMIGITADRQAEIVRIVFGTPVRWLGLPRHQAIALGELLIKRAKELDP